MLPVTIIHHKQLNLLFVPIWSMGRYIERGKNKNELKAAFFIIYALFQETQTLYSRILQMMNYLFIHFDRKWGHHRQSLPATGYYVTRSSLIVSILIASFFRIFRFSVIEHTCSQDRVILST